VIEKLTQKYGLSKLLKIVSDLYKYVTYVVEIPEQKELNKADRLRYLVKQG